MFRNMVTSLFKYDRIRTTDTKAKEVRRWADNLITLAKRGDLQARRQAMAIIREKGVVHKLFEEAPKRFGDVAGGYTRVVKIGIRAGDAAPMSLVELVTPDSKKGQKKRLKAAARAAVTPAVATPSAEAVTESEAVEAEAGDDAVQETPEGETVATADEEPLTAEAESATPEEADPVQRTEEAPPEEKQKPEES
jgi:large subunit ribosomal protein L17